MSLKERTINVDIMTKEYTKLKYKQGESGQNINIKLFKNGKQLDLIGLTVNAFFEKTNGEILEKSATINDNVATITLSKQILNIAGKIKTELYITKGEELVISFTIIIDVEESINASSVVEEKEEWDSIKDLLIKSNNLAMIDDNNVSNKTTSSSYKINSQLEDIKNDFNSQIKEKVNQVDLEVQKSRIDNLTTLAQGSTTGDAELIDGRVGANSFVYNNIGSAIRTQFEFANEKISENTDLLLKYDSILKSLENNNELTVSSRKIDNLLNIKSYKYSDDNFSITINNNIITVNGSLNDYTYIKLTNDVDICQGSSGGSKKYLWTQESYNGVTIGKKYSLKGFVLGGTAVNNNGDDVLQYVVASGRDMNYNSLLSAKKGLVTLENDIAYIQLYLFPGTYNNVTAGVILQEGELSTEFTPNGYYKSTTQLNYEYLVNDMKEKDYPTVINGSIKKEIPGTYFNAIQGGCTDGEFIYCGIVQNQDDLQNTVLHKINIKTNEIEKTVSNFSLGHCNSMTYCDYDGYIHCVSLNESSTIHRITTDLQYVDSYVVNIIEKYPSFTGFGAIDYNKEREQFIFLIRGDKKGYAIYSKNMNFIRIIWTDTIENHAYGGVCTDKNFIYQTVCGTNLEGIIGIFDWHGKLIQTVNINNFTGEIEECMLFKNKLFATANQDNYTNHNLWQLIPSSFTMIDS